MKRLGFLALAGVALVAPFVPRVAAAVPPEPPFVPPTYRPTSLRVAIGRDVFHLLPSRTTWVWSRGASRWAISSRPDHVPGAHLYGVFATSAHGVVGFVSLYIEPDAQVHGPR